MHKFSDMLSVMASISTWPALAAVVPSLFFSVALAQICMLDPYDYYVDRPEQVEALSRNCTTLQGWVYVQDNFTGSFNLPSVTNISGGLSVGNYLPSGLTDIQLPDLEHVGGFQLSGVKSASLPRLSVVEQSVEIRAPVNGSYHFPSLITVERISISGNLSRYRIRCSGTLSSECLANLGKGGF
jgi:hypothetical protein